MLKRKVEIPRCRKGGDGKRSRDWKSDNINIPQMQSFITHHETVRTLKTRRLPVQTIRELEIKNQNKNKNWKIQISLHINQHRLFDSSKSANKMQ
jgi:hypothetical protein